MRKIDKQPNPFPPVLIEWTQWQQGRKNCPVTYEAFKKYRSNNRDLRQILIDEQCGLCGYTGMELVSAPLPQGRKGRLEVLTEHVKPQDICKKEAGRDYGKVVSCDLDYHNMIAAIDVVAKISDLDGEYFGARKKGSEYDEKRFMKPTSIECESAFDFDIDGNVLAKNKKAKYTMDLLGLNHSTLIGERLGVILAYFPEDDFPNEEGLVEIIREMTTPENDKLPAFSFVIKALAEKFLLKYSRV